MKKLNLLALVMILSALLCLVDSGAAYSGGTMTGLGTFVYYPNSSATGINNKGQVVGYSYPNPIVVLPWKAFLYSGGMMTDLGTLGTDSLAFGINNNGQVVGYSLVNGHPHAFLYDKGGMQDLLGTLGGTDSIATGINDSGEVVGYYTLSGQKRAFLCYLGNMTDLGTLGGEYSQANAINNSGQIVGSARTVGGSDHAFLYTPSSQSLPAIQHLLLGSD